MSQEGKSFKPFDHSKYTLTNEFLQFTILLAVTLGFKPETYNFVYNIKPEKINKDVGVREW